MKNKLPPYGKKLFAFLSAGNVPTNDVYVFTGKWAFDKCESFKKNKFAMCLPKYTHPSYLDWPVEGCDILLYDDGSTSLSILEDIVLALLRDGANVVRMYLFNGDGRLSEPMRKYMR